MQDNVTFQVNAVYSRQLPLDSRAHCVVFKAVGSDNVFATIEVGLEDCATV